MKRPYAAYTAAPAGAAAPPAAGAAPTTAYANYGYGAPNQAKAPAATAPAPESGGLTKEQQQAQWHAQWQQYYAQQAAAAAQGGAAAPAPPTNAGPMQPQYAQPAMQVQPQQAQPQQQQQYYAQYPQQPAAVQQPQTPTQPVYAPQPSPVLQQPQQQSFAQQQQQPQALHYSGAQAGAYTAAGQQPGAYYPQAPGQFQPAPQQQQQAPSGPPQKRARYDGMQQGQQQQQWQPQQQAFVPPQSPMAPTAQPQMNFQQPQQQQQSFGWQGANSPPNGPAQGIGRGAPSMRGGATGYSGPPPQQQGFRAPSGPAGRGGVPFSPARAASGQFNAPSGPAAASPHINNAARFNGAAGINAMQPVGHNGGMATRGGAAAGAVRGGRGGHTAGFTGRGGLSSQNSIAAASPRNFGAQQRGGHVARGGAAVGRGGNHNQTAVFEQSRVPVIAAVRPSTIADQPVSINAKRTYTDFKIKSIEIPGIDWSWSIFDGIQEDDEEEAAEAETANSVAEGSPSKAKAGKKAIPTGPRSNVPATKESPAKSKTDVCRMRINFAAATLAPPVGAPTGPKAGLKVEKNLQAAPAEAAKPAAAVAAVPAPTPAAKASGSKSKVEAATNTEDEENAMNIDAPAPAASTDATMTNGEISIESLSPENVAFGQALKLPTAVPETPAWSSFSKGPPQCSMNRVGISYAAGRRRLTIDAETVRTLRVYRAEARAELVLNVTTAPKRAADKAKKGQEWVIIKGLLLETRSGENDSFAVVPRRQLEHAWVNQTFGLTEAEKKEALAKAAEEEAGADGDGAASSDDKSPSADGATDAEAVTEGAAPKKAAKEKSAEAEDDIIPGSYAELPPFFRVLSKHDGPADEQTYAARGASELVIKIAFDRLASPMEEKWLKTGDVSEWLSALPAFSSRLSQQVWQGKIEVVDPDPPPSMRDVCEAWAAQSLTGTPKDRRRFVAEQLVDATGQSQILARLVRDDKAFVTKLNARDLTAPLVEAAQQSRYGFAHTHLELAILALYGSASKYATAAGEAKVFEAQLNEMLMSIPQNLTFKALDGLFKIYSTELAEKQRVQAKTDKKNAEKAEKAAKKTKKAEKQAAAAAATTSTGGKDTTSKSKDGSIATSASEVAAEAGEAGKVAEAAAVGATTDDADGLITPEAEAEEPAAVAVAEAVDDALAQEVADAIMEAAVPLAGDADAVVQVEEVETTL